MLKEALNESASQAQPDTQRQKSQKSDKIPSTAHTLMDLIITLSIYLPRSSFPALFSLAAVILPQASDPQLQKKAYKLLPRLATSPTGALALQDNSCELQALLLGSAATASAPCRRDRLAAIAVVVEHLPPASLHFIPSILSEVVISAKEVNEKARTAAFDLLVLMGNKMQSGGTIAQNQIPHMPPDAPNATASLEEFFTIVSAGLVGSTPHMISASITALTRILYEFHSKLQPAVIEDLVSTMDLFLTSANREIVRSVLGFVKVAIISLPEAIIKPRLETLVRNLMSWSHEHKAHFRAKVKHVFERMIRRFGFELIERYCPHDDKKIIHNIRKTKERRKRKKEAGDGQDGDSAPAKRKSRFESEYDEAVYGSDESAEEDEHDGEAGHGGENGHAYIIEDSDEPLDLLDRKALGRISSSKPVAPKPRPHGPKRPKTDSDGKLIFGANDDDSEEDDAMQVDLDIDEGDGSLKGGINAYVDAIRGRDAAQRGRGGRLKFTNRREKADVEDDGGDDDGGRKPKTGATPARLDGRKTGRGASGRGAIGRGGGSGNRSASGIQRQKAQRRGLGAGKVRGGRVVKGRR